jgi:Beta-propeller repeat
MFKHTSSILKLIIALGSLGSLSFLNACATTPKTVAINETTPTPEESLPRNPNTPPDTTTDEPRRIPGETLEVQSCLSDPSNPCDPQDVSERNPALDAQNQADRPDAPITSGQQTPSQQAATVNTWTQGSYQALIGGYSNWPTTRTAGDAVLGQITLDAQDNLIAGGNIATRYGPTPGQGFVLKNLNNSINWTRTFGATNQTTYVNAVTSDSQNNIYATGWTSGDLNNIRNAGGNSDALLIKFGPQGNRIWTRLIGGNGLEGATGVTVDDQDQVYIMGYTNASLSGLNPAGSWDQFIMRFTPAGQHQWTALLGSSGNETSGRIAFADGKLYVSGSTTGNLKGQSNKGNNDAYVAQFSKLGQLNWTRSFGNSKNETVTGLKANPSGVWISGITQSQQLFGETSVLLKPGCPQYFYAPYSDGFITKFSATGTQQWGHLTSNASDEKFKWTYRFLQGGVPTEVTNAYRFTCRAESNDVTLDAQGRALVLNRITYNDDVPVFNNPVFQWRYQINSYDANGQRGTGRTTQVNGQYDASLESSSIAISKQLVLHGLSGGNSDAATDSLSVTVLLTP